MTGRDDTRTLIARAIGADHDDTDWSHAAADAVLAALAAAGKSIVDDRVECPALVRGNYQCWDCGEWWA